MSHQLLEWVGANVVSSVLLTVLAAVAYRYSRRPALTHTLCLLALVKLITPPLFELAVLPAPNVELEVLREREAQLSHALTMPMEFALSAAPAPLATVPVHPGWSAPGWPGGSAPEPFDWLALMLWIWALGAVLLWTRAIYRVGRTTHLLAQATAAPRPLAAQVRVLAQQLGVRPPRILVTSARVSPAVTSTRRGPTLVLPASLWQQLDAAQREALLLHELAHLKRGDHLVRWIELLIVPAFWWLPTIWWTRALLHEAEERCCDAWVLATTREDRAYADALVTTVGFLSGAAAASPLASGAGRIRHLRERLKSIMSAETKRGLCPRSRTLVALCAMALPVLPSRAQEQTEQNIQRVERALQRVKELEKQLSELQKAAAKKPEVSTSRSYGWVNDPELRTRLETIFEWKEGDPKPERSDVSLLELLNRAKERSGNTPFNVNPLDEAATRALFDAVRNTQNELREQAGQTEASPEETAPEAEGSTQPDVRYRGQVDRSDFGTALRAYRELQGQNQPGAAYRRLYRVQRGDSLAQIARKNYGSTKYWKQIAEANKLADPRRLAVGQQLYLPYLQNAREYVRADRGGVRSDWTRAWHNHDQLNSGQLNHDQHSSNSQDPRANNTSRQQDPNEVDRLRKRVHTLESQLEAMQQQIDSLKNGRSAANPFEEIRRAARDNQGSLGRLLQDPALQSQLNDTIRSVQKTVEQSNQNGRTDPFDPAQSTSNDANFKRLIRKLNEVQKSVRENRQTGANTNETSAGQSATQDPKNGQKQGSGR